MCMPTSRIIDPAGLLYGGSAKWADPLGLTKTAIGDPTGRVRKSRQSELEQSKGTYYTQQADGTFTKNLGSVPTGKTALGG